MASSSSSSVGNHGLLVLFGNDRARMLPNAALFDTDELTWQPVDQLGTVIQGRSGHTLTNIGEFMGDIDPYVSPSSSSTMVASGASPSSSSSAAAAGAAPALRIPKTRFILIGGKRIFPDTVHYNEVFICVYDASRCTLTWRPLPLTGVAEPDPRSYHSAVWRPENNVVYIFGGIISNIYSSELATLNPITGLWRTVTPAEVPGYSLPVARSGHVAFLIEDGTKMLVAGSYNEDSEEITVATLTFATMRWTVAKVDPKGSTPSRRAAISGGVLPPMSGGARLPMLVVFAGFELSARRCFNDLFVMPF